MSDEAPAAADNAEPVATEAVETTTSETTSWRAGLPDELRDSPSLEKFEASGVEGLARSYVNIERMIGGDKIVIPKQGDKDGWEKVWG